MKTQATYDDAELILRLYDLRREPLMRTARKWMGGAPVFTSREHWLTVCPPGSDENAYYRQVTTYWDMAAAFVVTGVLNRELFYRANNMELLFVWEKVKQLVPELRAVNKSPLTLHNMEEVANGFIAFLAENAPGFYEQWSGNIAKGAAPPPRPA